MKREATKALQKVRIIGGFWRSRMIQVANVPGLRPSTDRVRETLFNWLGQRLDGLSCLDMFAGTGVLGLEAASRGASHVTLIESHPDAQKALKSNLEHLAPNPPSVSVEIVRGDALIWAKKSQDKQFEVIFIDPPFADSNLLQESLLVAEKLANPDVASVIYVECPSEVTNESILKHLTGWEISRQMVAGLVKASLLKRIDSLA